MLAGPVATCLKKRSASARRRRTKSLAAGLSETALMQQTALNKAADLGAHFRQPGALVKHLRELHAEPGIEADLLAQQFGIFQTRGTGGFQPGRRRWQGHGALRHVG